MPRFAATIIAFLTAAGIQTAISATLPPSADICLVSLYIRQQMYVMALACIHSLLMLRQHDKCGQVSVDKFDNAASVAFVSYWIVSWAVASLCSQADAAPIVIGVLLAILVHIGFGFLYINAEHPLIAQYLRKLSCQRDHATQVPVAPAPQEDEKEADTPHQGAPGDATRTPVLSIPHMEACSSDS